MNPGNLQSLCDASARLADAVPRISDLLSDQVSVFTTPVDGGVAGDGMVKVRGAGGVGVTVVSYRKAIE